MNRRQPPGDAQVVSVVMHEAEPPVVAAGDEPAGDETAGHKTASDETAADQDLTAGDESARPGAGGDERRKAWRVLGRRSLVLFGLAGLAITQPVLDLFGRNPEFFVAGGYSRGQIVVFVLVVGLVPALAGSAVLAVSSLLHPGVGAVTYRVGLAGLGGLLGLVLLRSLGVDALWLAVIAAVAIAGAVVWLERTRLVARRFLSYLAVGNLAFMGLFLFDSSTSDLITAETNNGGGDRGVVQVPPLDGPVILLILDELPVTTLMREDGSLNDERFPNFARLADGATWFRNASSRSSHTTVSVPNILTGRLGKGGALPNHADHPRNYLTLFGTEYPVERYESVTDLCPSDVCEPVAGNELRQAMQDALVVYGRRTLPQPLRDELPAVDQSWGNFGDQLGGLDEAATAERAVIPTKDDPWARWHGLDVVERSSLGQARIVDDMTRRIDATPSINLTHVALPHFPWTLTPWGHRIIDVPEFMTDGEFRDDPNDPASELLAVQRYATHAMQVGAADVVVGGLIDHLQETGAWDDALVVVTSDHGVGLLPPDFGRSVSERNREQLLRIPLFVKAPGQTTGEVRDDPAQTIDVLPSIVDLLGIETDWTFDGHSLFDGSTPTVEPVVAPNLTPAREIAARHAAATRHGDDWVGLAAVGDHGDLVGLRVDELDTGDPSALSWQLDAEDELGSLPTDDGQVPQVLTGTVATPDGERPPELVVEINGRLAGVVGAYRPDGDGWRFTGVMAPFLRDGPNDVVGYEVERAEASVVLHPVGG